MRDEKPVWAKRMADSPFADRHFTKQLTNRVLHRVNEKGDSSRRVYKFGAAVIMLLVVVLVFGFGGSPSREPVNVHEQKEYFEKGRMIFSVAPQPDARAGEMNGYIFHFEDAIETFKGKRLTIQAVQLQTGRIETVASEKIEIPSNGYPGLERYAIPIHTSS